MFIDIKKTKSSQSTFGTTDVTSMSENNCGKKWKKKSIASFYLRKEGIWVISSYVEKRWLIIYEILALVYNIYQRAELSIIFQLVLQ